MSPAPQLLQWDSDHFGVRIARTDAPRTNADWDAIDEWAFANQINCMYVFAEGKDTTGIRLAEERGGRCMDERVILEAIVTNSPAIDALRPATEADLPALEEIAARSFTESRFYRDPNLRHDLAESLFRTWIRKSVNGWAQSVLVCDENGFVTCRDGKIDLLAVAESARGKGIGALLTNGAKNWFATHGIRRVSVLARAKNDSAIRLYQRCGFVPARSEVLFHKWYKT